MYVVVAQFDVRPEHQAAFLEALLQGFARMRTEEPGALRCEMSQDVGDANRLLVCEVYRDAAARAMHNALPAVIALRQRMAGEGWLVRPPAIHGEGPSLYPPDDAATWGG